MKSYEKKSYEGCETYYTFKNILEQLINKYNMVCFK